MSFGTGFPTRTGRPGLTDGGATLSDERPLADPRRELGAACVELLCWQVGAFGLLSPLCAFLYEPGGGSYTERLHYGGFAWDTSNTPGTLQVPPFDWFTATRNAAGDYTFSFSATAPDANGDAQAVAFSGGLAKPQGISGSALGNLRAELELVSSTVARARVRAQPGGALTEAPVAVLLW